MSIAANVQGVLRTLPPGVMLAAAAKTRTAQEVNEAIAAGVRIVGENYLQDAEDVFDRVTKGARWHFIGHLQSNKVKRAVEIFDMIETVDSRKLAAEIEKRAASIDKIIDVLIEVNSAREAQKSGIFPEHVAELAESIASLPHLRLRGLMTMGPVGSDEHVLRACFRETKDIFDALAIRKDPRMCMDTLSMGMSDSYLIAIEEGANLVRLGTAIFGVRS